MALTPSLTALAAIAKLDRRSYRATRTATGWQATVTAGYSDGACPVWVAEGETREAAIERAAATALDYWSRPSAAPGVTRD